MIQLNQTKDIIVTAFWQLLDEKPFNQVTVKDIVTRCQVNRNTFYYHFHDIPELVEYSIKEDVDAIMRSNNPVSYTHLDVYKRQIPSRVLIEISIRLFPSAGAG